MKRVRSRDSTEEETERKNKIFKLKVYELQQLYALCQGLPQIRLKNDLREALMRIVDGTNQRVGQDIRDSIKNKLDELTRNTPNYIKKAKNMPNTMSVLNPLANGVASQYSQIVQQEMKNVRMKTLPFYTQLAILKSPSPLQSNTYTTNQVKIMEIFLTGEQVNLIHNNRKQINPLNVEYNVQVLVRLCEYNDSVEQMDSFPITFELYVNNRNCQLPPHLPCRPGQIPKRPPKPLDVTRFLKISPAVPNKIELRWRPEQGKIFAIAAYLVHKQTSDELFEKVKKRGIMPSHYTRDLIKEKLKEDGDDGEIATTMLRVSLLCPLGQKRMTTPCRASTCKHLQCFDALPYLQMNELHAKWNCPVCDKEILFDNLVIDGYFMDVIEALDTRTKEVQLHKDGTWTQLDSEKENGDAMSQQFADNIEILDSDDEQENHQKDDMINNNKPAAPSFEAEMQSKPKLQLQSLQRPLMNGDIVDLTLDDD